MRKVNVGNGALRLHGTLPADYWRAARCSEPDAYSAGQTYFPDGMQPAGWYQPTERGLEAKIREKLAQLKNKK